MKKSISLLLVAGMLSLAACGPSEKEKAAEAARVQDSITHDSTMRAEQEAQAAAALAMQATQDSLAKIAQDSLMKVMQDSIAALNKKTPVKSTPKTPKQVDPKDVKPGQGRG